MAKRLPKRAFHQFMPIDHPDFCKKFLSHWKPDMVLWLESDFWPSMISEIKANDTKLILVNGRISDKTFNRWSYFKPIIKQFLNCFTHCMGQTDEDARRLKVLGAKSTSCSGNLKFAGLPLPKDENELKKLQKEIGNRKVVLFACTHNDEEVRLAKIHNKLAKKHKNLLSIIIPRHAVRGAEIKTQINELEIKTSLRSTKEEIKNDTSIYLADTMGEMGLFYSLCDIVFIGGSLIPHGGQNFIEPSRMDCAIITGPHMHNFTEAIRKSKDVNGIAQCRTEDEVYEKLNEYLSNDKLKEEMIKNAKFYADKENHVLDDIVLEVERYMK
jgi:3-deoxy-D-manno-octulosonic-acid transferase